MVALELETAAVGKIVPPPEPWDWDAMWKFTSISRLTWLPSGFRLQQRGRDVGGPARGEGLLEPQTVVVQQI